MPERKKAFGRGAGIPARRSDPREVGPGPKPPPRLVDETPPTKSPPHGVADSVHPSDLSVSAVSHATDGETCLVCYDHDLSNHRAILPCGHDEICGPCHLRLRYLHSDMKCPVCKAHNEKIIVDMDPHNDGTRMLDEEMKTHRSFESYQMWGDELGSGHIFRENVGMFFPLHYYSTDVLPAFSLGCGVERCDFTNEEDSFVAESVYNKNQPDAKQKRGVKRLGGMKALNEHLRAKHGRTLCNLCVEEKRDFVSKLPRFTPSGLKFHLSKGDGEGSGFKGHPLCDFCRPRRFYDLSKVSFSFLPNFCVGGNILSFW